MPTLLDPGNLRYPPGHEKEIPLEYIMQFFKTRVRGLGGAIHKAKDMSDRILLLRAETGGGKSTTIPPELHLRFSDTVHGRRKLIACTQPTRLNTTTIPQNIAKIFPKLKLGENLGYQTGPISYKISSGVLYMTIETIVEQIKTMEEEDFMKRYSFIVIDEAHHRDLPTDVALSMIKNLIKKNIHKEICPFLIIMSATLDVKHFAQFMETKSIIEVAGAPHFIEQKFSKNDVEQVIPQIIDTIKKIHKTETDDFNQKIRDILVFVPGLSEITSIIEEISDMKDLLPIPLYRDNFIRGTTEFWNIFEPIEKLGVKRRAIISTAIAETGVTIDTVKYVIDSGWARVSEFYAPYGISSLVTKPASQSSAIQRRGRCGRKGAGVWYPMYTQKTFETMQEIGHPDIIRGEATTALLDLFVKNGINLNEIELLDTPSSDSLTYSMELLYVLGSIDTKTVTPLGELMSTMRLPIPHARMILAGYVYNVSVIDLIIMTTGMLSARDIIGDSRLYDECRGTKFLTQNPMDFKHTNLNKKYGETRLAMADEFIEYIFLLDSFVKMVEGSSIDKLRKWTESMGLNYVGFMTWIAFKNELIIKLQEMGFNVNKNIPLLESKTETEFINTVRNIKRCILEGFKLNVATYTPDGYVSERHKFLVKPWSPLLKTGNTPNYIIYDEARLSYNSKLELYILSVAHISVMDGWISREYDSKFTVPNKIKNNTQNLNIKNMWTYKKMTATKNIKEEPVKEIKDIEQTYEEQILHYTGGSEGHYVVAASIKNVTGGEPEKILVF